MSSIARRTRLLRIAVALLIALSAIGPWSPVTGTRHALAVDEGVPDHYAALVGASINVSAPGYSANDNVQSGALDGCSLQFGGVFELPPGQLSNDGNGGFSFTPDDPGFQGSGRFEYNCFVYLNGVFDHAYTAIVTLYFVNSLAVTAADDEYYVAEGQSLQIEAPGVLDNDLSEIPTTLATGPDAFQGLASIADDGSFTYTPPPTTGDFGFPYTLTNALGTSDTAFATVHVLGALTLADDAYTTPRNTPLIVPAPGVIGNDPSKNSIFGVVVSSAPTSGTATVFGGLGGIKYTPDTDFTGADSFTYTVTDALGRIKTATVTVMVVPPTASLSRSRTTVNTLVRYTLTGFVPSNAVQVLWVRANGSTIALPNATVDAAGSGSGSFKVPATVGGAGQKVRFKQGSLVTEVPFEIIPRIKVLTDPAQRGQAVNVSLRGYAKGETVRIRWKNGSRFVQLTSVKTSSTGSANVNIVVPSFAADGEHTVRGDGTVFRSETKVVTVLGGPSAAEVVEPTATVSPSPTATPTPSPTATVTATPSPSPEPTAEATLEPTSLPTAVPTIEITPDTTPAPDPTSEPTPEVTVESVPPVDPSPEVLLDDTAAVD